MGRPVNHDDARCALCEHVGYYHESPEYGGRCHMPDRGGECTCPGFETPPDDEGEIDGYEPSGLDEFHPDTTRNPHA